MKAKDTVMKVEEMDDYKKASAYLIGVALSTGEGFMLRAIKSLMDNKDKSYTAGAVNERERVLRVRCTQCGEAVLLTGTKSGSISASCGCAITGVCDNPNNRWQALKEKK